MSWSLSKFFPSRFIPTWLLTWLPAHTPAGTYQVTATTAATPVDVRIVYRD